MGMTIAINDPVNGEEIRYLGKGGNQDFYLYRHYLPAHIVAPFDNGDNDNRSLQGLTGLTGRQSLPILESLRDAVLSRQGRWDAWQYLDGTQNMSVMRANKRGHVLATGEDADRASAFILSALVIVGEMIETAKEYPNAVWEIEA
jgi:hypothetical protein